MKSKILVIHGEKGAGKTNRAVEIAKKARKKGLKVLGILSKRILVSDKTLGYDGLDLSSNVRFPLARIKESVKSSDWQNFGNLIFSFNKKGFQRANSILKKSAKLMDKNTIIIIDEYGHLEIEKKGLYPGFIEVIESLDNGGLVVILCRTDKTEPLLRFLLGEKVLSIRADCQNFWASLGDSFI
jgi:nucleoside-triphosphatase THEP1